MTNHNLSSTNHIASHTPKLSANEQAIIDSIGAPFLRKLVTAVWRVKVRLQFTGWLQYVPPTMIALLFWLVSAVFWLFGLTYTALPFATIGAVLTAVTLFDLITVKFKLRFPEPLPQPLDHLDLFDLMRARQSCRSFQTRQLTTADHDALLNSVRRHSTAPTIGDAPIRFEYIAASLTVWPVVNASQFLVAIAPKEYNRMASIDIGRSLQKIVMDATRMGLGTCWIGPGADQTSVIQHLGHRFDPQTDHIICVCAVGYESWYIPLFLRIFNKKMHQRLPLSSLFFANHFAQPLDVNAPPFDQFGRAYEICQWAPSSYNGQTTRCVAVTGQASGTMRFDFYAATASRYYAAVALGIWCANWELANEALGLNGRFTILPTTEKTPTLPKYDVSWVQEPAGHN